MLSIGAIASAAQGASYYEQDGYYTKDDPEHREASAWFGKGAEALGLNGPVDSDTFRAILEGKVPDGSGTELGRRGPDGEITHRPGRDLTFSAPKSVSIAALVGGDARIVDVHDRAVKATLAWVEKNAVEARVQDPETGRMVRTGGQKTVVAAFRHDTSRNLDPQLHTHAVIANMVQGEDGKWRSMANEKLYESKMLLGALYRSELAAGLARLGYGIEKTHADGRFEIAGVSREVVEAFSTRRQEIEAAVAERGLGAPADNPRHAERAALMTRATKREVDRGELRDIWQRQAVDLGLDAGALAAEGGAGAATPPLDRAGESLADARTAPEVAVVGGSKGTAPGGDGPANAPAPGDARATGVGHVPGHAVAAEAVTWALDHLSERDAVFRRTALLAAALSVAPGTLTIEAVEREVAAREADGTLHAVHLPGARDSLATDRTVGEERETIALMRAGEARGKAPMRSWVVRGHLRRGPLTAGQRDAVQLILSARDRVVGVQGYAGTGKTTMLDRARTLAEKKGWRMVGLAPSASAVQTLAAEAGIGSQTLQGFLARNAGVAAGRVTRRSVRALRAAFAKTILVVDEGSLASTVQAGDLLRIADELRIPRVVLVGDAKQLDAVDAGKPFAQLQAAGMPTAVMDEILRQRDPALKEAVEASLRGEIRRAFDRLGANVTETGSRDIAGTVAERWLALTPEARERTGVMAPSHELRLKINGHIRDELAREGRLHGPAVGVERLVSKGYTQAEKALAGNYAKGDVVAFYRDYQRIGVAKGDERRVSGVDHARRAVLIDDGRGGTVAWKPAQIGGRKGGTEVYRAEGIELRAGDRIRWTRNDAGLGVVNSRTAEVLAVGNGRVAFRLEDGRNLVMGDGDPQLRHLDHAWASTAHAFQGRTVDNVIAAMEARHPHLTTQKGFYVEISRARDRAELVTDDAGGLCAQLQAATGERIAALEGIGEMPREARDRPADAAHTRDTASEERTAGIAAGPRTGSGSRTTERESADRERSRGQEPDLGL
ncbi:MAG: conjugative relaxase [Rhodospirillales bacterium]|nr:conjugative relaxase [Rhodospirillales bacterium]